MRFEGACSLEQRTALGLQSHGPRHRPIRREPLVWASSNPGASSPDARRLTYWTLAAFFPISPPIQASTLLLMSAMACCRSAVRGAERKKRDQANGEASFYRQPSSDLRAGADGIDRDGRWLDHRSHLHDLLFGVELFSGCDVARALALRSNELLSVCSYRSEDYRQLSNG